MMRMLRDIAGQVRDATFAKTASGMVKYCQGHEYGANMPQRAKEMELQLAMHSAGCAYDI
ncbi:hypothetical protein ACLOJK_012346 [Asimina triloba]